MLTDILELFECLSVVLLLGIRMLCQSVGQLSVQISILCSNDVTSLFPIVFISLSNQIVYNIKHGYFLSSHPIAFVHCT